jgi:hypothetical protein
MASSKAIINPGPPPWLLLLRATPFFLFGSDTFTVCLLRSVRWVAKEQSLSEFLLNTKEERWMTPLLTKSGLFFLPPTASHAWPNDTRISGRLIFYQCFGLSGNQT